ncbi:hypothetical protein [Pseudooceanicola sp. MF1-13]|uniref:hypothetical protein n=1 Tax=Pseudooceanicola sp. MF1-13 TaxID=3379095 RepID=UPI003891FCF6
MRAILICLSLLMAGSAMAQSGHGSMGHGVMGHGHGADGTGHDMVNMPGLRGKDATPEESAEMAEMFRYFALIERDVENLPNGIRATTRTEDEALATALISHITGMIARVEEGRDPQVFIQSPTLDILFERRDAIVTEIEAIDGGLIVTQTSDDPEVVAALHTHAAEVSDMALRGMDAVHERMMKTNH